MNTVENLIRLSTTTSEDFDTSKLDKVFNEVLLPKFESYAKNFKRRRIRLTDNLSCNKVNTLMKDMFNGKYTVQSLIETEMKRYLEDKGFKVHIWSPNYSVEVSW